MNSVRGASLSEAAHYHISSNTVACQAPPIGLGCNVPPPRAANRLSTGVLVKCLEGMSLPRKSGIISGFVVL